MTREEAMRAATYPHRDAAWKDQPAAWATAGADAELTRVVAYLNECKRLHDENAEKRGYSTASKHHADACRLIAAALLDGAHWLPSDA